jgi:hypothetical protein
VKEPAGYLQWNGSARDSISAISDPKYLKIHTKEEAGENGSGSGALAVGKTSSICYPTISINIHYLPPTAHVLTTQK